MTAERKPGLIALFDVNGTLTAPGKVVTPKMLEFMRNLRKVVTVGVVGGSDLVKISEQLGKTVVDDYDYVFSENGLVAHKNGKLIETQRLKSFLGEEKLKEFINFTLRYIADLDIPIKRGTFVEFRSGMLNVSPIGQNCSQEEGDEFEKYDRVHNVRTKMVSVLREKFAHLNLTFSIGGQISFDVFPQGWDKTYYLRYLEEFNEIHFFGGKTYQGENDYKIYESERTMSHTVTNPTDTVEQCTALFLCKQIGEIKTHPRMAEIDLSAVREGGDGAIFEGWLDNFSPDVERAGKELLQCLRKPKIRAICVRGYEGLGRWSIVEYAARELEGSDLFDVQIMVKLPKEDWSPRNVQREIGKHLVIKEGDDEDDDLQMEVSFEIDESLKGKRLLLILGDATQRIHLDDMGVSNIRNTKVVYISSERLESEETIEFQDFPIDVLREEAVAVASSPSIAACFTPHVVLDCFFYLLLFHWNAEVGQLTRYWIAEGIMVMREGIEEEEDLTTLEKKVDALLIELKARSMVEQAYRIVMVPKRLAEKAIEMVMSSDRRASTHGKFWIRKYSLPTENNGEWEDIQRMAIWNLRRSDHLPLTLKFPKLSTLLLEGPSSRPTLPNNFFFEQMQGLRVLILSVLEIRSLPLSLSSLHNLRFFSIYRCQLLEPESLLSSLQALDKLEFLEFKITELESIPNECLQHKNNLRSLHLSNIKTRSLPSSFPQLQNLQQLSITSSSSLIEIPDAFFERLPRLQVLNLAHDDNLKSLPSSLSKLVNLRQLILTQCSSLKIELLPHLQKLSAALEVLDLHSCNSIEDIEEVSSSLGAVLPNLQKLDLSGIEVIKQVSLKGCISLESLRLFDLTRLDAFDLSGTQLQQLPKGISTASHLRRLEMLHMNHIRKIDWDDLTTELEEFHLNHCGTSILPKDDENPRDEGGPQMRISNHKLLQSLKPSSQFLRAKCFSRFHIRISPYQEEKEEGRRRAKGIHLQGRKSIYKDINLKTQKCNLPLPSCHFHRLLEIQGGKRCTNAIQGVLSRTELLTLWDNAFIRDLGDVEMHELRKCLVKSCGQMEIFFGRKNQCFECLEKIWMSDLASMRRVCDGMGRIISFPLLKHIYLEHCPRLVNFVSSGVSLLSLEKLEIRFCNRLESLFQGDVVLDGSLQRLHTVHLWELPKLERICSSRYLPALKKLTVRGCGKLKELPLRAGPNNAIMGGGGVEVVGEMAWWENLRWEDESIKHDIHFIEWRPLTWR